MTFIQWVQLGAAISGATGTIILFCSSYSLEPYEGGVMGSPEVYEYNELVKSSNRVRLRNQRIGLGLLCFSFVLQAFAVFL